MAREWEVPQFFGKVSVFILFFCNRILFDSKSPDLMNLSCNLPVAVQAPFGNAGASIGDFFLLEFAGPLENDPEIS